VSGVPQGTVMGPLLSLIFINDLPECVTSNTQLFTDDAIVYKEIKSQSDTLELQKNLIALEEWEKTWDMSFAPSTNTCCVLLLRKTSIHLDVVPCMP
jgi:hypothetical protein